MNSITTKNIKLIVAYDGTKYLGWQKNKDGPSVEKSLQDAIEQILQEPIYLQAASRTDAGVHSEGQVVNFITTKAISLQKLQKSINAIIDNDISIMHIEEMPFLFHPTTNCKKKIYTYYICNSSVQLPHHRLFSWHCYYTLDIKNMRLASSYFIGNIDLEAFCNHRKELKYDSFYREITNINIIELPHKRLKIEIEGHKFLYKMVRNIIGTLVHVGMGKIKVDEIPHIIKCKKRKFAGITAPAHGLFLTQVLY